MVLTQKNNKMSSEQPVKKKLRRENEQENSDEPDFIHNLAEDAVPTDFQALHLSLPLHINENDITRNTVNLHYSENGLFRTNEDNSDKKNNDDDGINSYNISIKPAPDICSPSKSSDDLYIDSLDDFQKYLIKQCLCEIPDIVLRKQFEGQQINDSSGIRTTIMLSEWSDKKILHFLSNLQLLFDVYLKQNNNGLICSKIVSICEALICNEYNLIEQIISLCEARNKYINFLAARTLSSFLVIAKTNINNEWLETIVNFFSSENYDFVKIQFALEIVKRVVEWKDIEQHVLEVTEITESAGPSTKNDDIKCITVPFTDPESYDTSSIKGLIIKSLEAKWPELIHMVQHLLVHNNSVAAQTCVLTFLSLWESTISIKANLSVIDTKPFYTHLEIFVGLLNSQLPPLIWKKILSLFNEVLCYGSTLALQDMLPEDTCQLAHLLVRYVKDYRLLDSLPFKRNEGFIVNSFVGTIVSLQAGQSNVDRTLLQKMILLILKSVAVTIKETRSDSSDSSIGSDDSDFYQDMQLIERSIRDVLKKVDVFVKNCLDFHPESPFSKIIVHLFSDQDDYMIEAMVCTLDITIGISYRNAVYPDLLNMLNPIHSFIEFLKVVSHDSDILLDYLVSNETCFLLYLLRFLKFTKRNWSRFISSCGEGSTSRSNELDDTMSVLIRLKMQITRLVSKDLFPYNITPILRLLETCENLYEGNEFS
ncbi:protein lines [Diorhabda carinulata]|uniref:protein lines n=1 Tax=Diorhabda carinulata TaxID=1163345 RepID=UPI0025A028B6|nr:protein lines [Diorhabda carinulata]